MPIATADTLSTVRKDLKSLPEAYVELRRMTYGQIVERRAMMKMSIATDGKDKKSLQGELAMANKEIARFEFRHCIVGHNLEKEVNGEAVPLNLSDARDFDSLDPKVGQEIEKYIGDMNNFEDEDQEN